MNTKIDWKKHLSEDMYIRLCACSNKRSDLVPLAKVIKIYNPDATDEDCFILALEWVGDWNGQYAVTDLTDEEFNKMVKKVGA